MDLHNENAFPYITFSKAVFGQNHTPPYLPDFSTQGTFNIPERKDFLESFLA
jgi:hypothetical protein